MPNNKKIKVLSHLLTWLVLFSMPYLLSYGQSQDINRIIARFWIPLVFSAIIFYCNYFVLIDRFLFTKKTVWFIATNAISIAFFLFLKEYIEGAFFQEFLQKSSGDTNAVRPPFKMIIYVQLVSYMAPLLFSIAIKNLIDNAIKYSNDKKVEVLKQKPNVKKLLILNCKLSCSIYITSCSHISFLTL